MERCLDVIKFVPCSYLIEEGHPEVRRGTIFNPEVDKGGTDRRPSAEDFRLWLTGEEHVTCPEEFWEREGLCPSVYHFACNPLDSDSQEGEGEASKAPSAMCEVLGVPCPVASVANHLWLGRDVTKPYQAICPIPHDSRLPTVTLLPVTSQAEAHYKGSKHAKKLKAQDSGKTKQKSTSAKNGSKAGSAGTNGPSAGPPNKTDKSEKRAASSNMMRPTTRSAGSLPVSVPKPATLETTPRETAPLALPVKNGEVPPPTESEEEKARKLLYCSLCKVAVNSLSQLEAHNTGSKHKTMLEARNGAGPIKAYPRPGSKLKVQTSVVKGSGLQNKTFHCEICDVHVNSEIQLKQHISSRRHKDRVAGKPMKPKYSPYNKQQRSPSILAAKLAFQKDIVKPLAPSFLSHPFSAAAMSSLPLQARPNASLFQTPALPPSLLRAAPGPLRPPAGSILFAPY
ncbi:Z385B protein, partial [Polypterus senegalus]